MTRTPTLGATIRARRIELGWSQEELTARISGEGGLVRQSEVSRLELDKVVLPRRARLGRLAAALDLPLGELLVRSGWGGADAAFGHRPEETAAPLAEKAPPPTPGAWVHPLLPVPPAPAPEPPETVVRLREALARSRELLLRTASVLDRAQRTYDLAAEPGDRRRAH